MHQRRSQYRGAAISGGNPRHNLDLHVRILRTGLVHQASHAVDPGVSAAHHRHVPAPCRLLQRHLAALYFLGHGGGQIRFLRVLLFNQIYIHRISYDDLAFIQRSPCLQCHLPVCPGPQPYHIYLTHLSSPLCLLSGIP